MLVHGCCSMHGRLCKRNAVIVGLVHQHHIEGPLSKEKQYNACPGMMLTTAGRPRLPTRVSCHQPLGMLKQPCTWGSKSSLASAIDAHLHKGGKECIRVTWGMANLTHNCRRQGELGHRDFCFRHVHLPREACLPATISQQPSCRHTKCESSGTERSRRQIWGPWWARWPTPWRPSAAT